MRGFFSILKKDLNVFFKSPTIYLVGFLCMIIMGWIYSASLDMFRQMVNNFMYQPGMTGEQMNIHLGLFMRHMSYLNLVLILVVPALTMRLISEERKMKTFDLLMTSPVTSFQIVLGKYIAGLISVGFIVALAFSLCIFTGLFAKIEWGLLLISFFGVMLIAGIYVSMDLFCSALTESALGAFVMSVLINISIWFVSIGAEVSDSQTLRDFFEHISINTHMISFFQGTIRSSSVIFLLSAIGLFLFLAERVVESNRWRS